MKEYLTPAEVLAAYMQRIYDRGLTTMSGGNLSVMDEAGNLWITPSGIDKGGLTPEDMICVRPDGTEIGRHRPSCELPFHQSVYRLRPDVKAVLHAHPSALGAFSMVRKLPRRTLLAGLDELCPEMRMAGYAVPGSQTLGGYIGKVFAQGFDAALLENHGVCVCAADMQTAFARFEALDYAAEVELQTVRAGKLLPPAEAFAPATFAPLAPQEEYSAQRREMVRLVRRCYRTGLFLASLGECSVRVGEDSFLITPAGGDRGRLNEDEPVLVRGGCAEAGKQPCREAALHARIYRENPGVHAILAASPVHAAAFAATDAALDARTIPESYIQLRDVAELPRETTEEALAKSFCPDCPVVCVKGRGFYVTGGTLLQAFDRMEVLEFTARAMLNTAPLGKIVRISDSEIDEIKTAFQLP